jgi:manganese transport system permease protein
MVVLTQGVVFGAVYLFSPRQGLIGTRLAKARRRKAAALAV